MKNTHFKWLLAFCLGAHSSFLFAQNNYFQWSDIASIVLQEEDFSEETFLYELLEEIYENPVDINNANIEKLSIIPFLSLSQIEDILDYVKKNGEMKTLGELQLIESLDYNTRILLSYFVCAGERNLRTEGPGSLNILFRQGKQKLILKGEIPLYSRSGFNYHTTEELENYPNRAYLGNKYPHSLRYSFNWKDRIRFGINAGKDAGETFFKGSAPWYDYCSAYLSIDGFSKLRHLTVGNLKAAFGQGLVINTAFGFGKQMALSSIDRQNSGFRPHSSNSETGYFTGIGATFAFGRISISAMASYTFRDATLKDEMVSSFKTDGYHRTPLELSKKHNTTETTGLIHAGWSWNSNQIGFTLLFDRYDRIILQHRTNIFWNASADWSLRWNRFTFLGEAAITGLGGCAAINVIKYRIYGRNGLSLILRHYSPDYVAFNGKSFSEKGLSNESGAFLGAITRFAKFDLSIYCDLFLFSEHSYRASDSSGGFDTQIQLTSSELNSADKIECRYRFKNRGYDSNDLGCLASRNTGRLKMSWEHRFTPFISLKSLFNFTHSYFPDTGFEKGLSLSESFSFNTANGKISGSVTTGIFHTDSGNVSVSIYENGLLYDYNFITLSGSGTRNSFVIKYNILPSLFVTLKCGSTIYFDREAISSSQQKIDSFHKEDISLQLQVKF
ncbi:MAG: helix-hairpin-helix domain-containing protein [Bacteroidaceae bacterium]|nr:helix-hairpin-helix domain-containing protein [Bacteroidaceae bacterium]